MPNYKKVYLKKDKETPLKNQHRWIFSGAIDKADKYEDGEILQVFSSKNELLGHAYMNSKTTIAGRMLNFSNEDPIVSIKKHIKIAFEMRKTLIDTSNTNCYRIINGENDNIPGLTADLYNEVLVIQISTAGMDRLKPTVLPMLAELFNNKISIYEKSSMPSRRIDGLKDSEGWVYGDEKQKVEVAENGIKFLIDFINGQKTGFFLDMREMRKLIGQHSKNKKVLNCFSYSGGFSLYALKAGATLVNSVEISEQANDLAKTNHQLNGFDYNKNTVFTQDTFDFLKKNSKLDYDIVILDPPAFAKKKMDIKNALRRYYELNKQTMSKMNSGSILLTCSCSYHIPDEAFEKMVKKAGIDSGKDLKVISKHRMALDHGINIYHTEFDYLKSLVLYVI